MDVKSIMSLLALATPPGRNIAINLEVSALNHWLKELGIHPAQQLNERLMSLMSDPDG